MLTRDYPKNLIYIQIIYNFVIKFLITDLHFPSMLNYVTDIITVLLLFRVLKDDAYKIRLGENASMAVAVLLLFVGTLSALFSFESSPLLYIWSLRNNFRPFIFFYCCYKILNEEDVRRLLEIILAFLYINIFLCVFEYVARGVEYDFLGGTFGNGIQGGNGPLHALLIIGVSYLIIEYINRRKSIWNLLLGVGGSLFIATVGELKVFYFEIIVLIILVGIFVTHNMRSVVFVLAISVIGLVGMSFYVKLYPHRAGFLSLAFIQKYSGKETYGVSSNMNRLTAFRMISDRYTRGMVKKVLFGLGMGNGEMSSQYSFLTSPFYRQNGVQLRYDWFSHSFMYVEFGAVGLVLYLLFFILAGFRAFRNKDGNPYNQTALLGNVFLVLMVFYNQALRIESTCYLAAFIAAIPYIVRQTSLPGKRKDRIVQHV